MPDEPAADALARERAIVEESIAAVGGSRTTEDDHPEARRRVRVVIDAIRAAR